MAISTAVPLSRHGVRPGAGLLSGVHKAGVIERDWLFDLRGL